MKKDNNKNIADIRYLQGFTDGIGCITNMLIVLLDMIQKEDNHDKNVLQVARMVQSTAEILKNSTQQLNNAIDKLAEDNNIKLENDEVLMVNEETLELRKEKNKSLEEDDE